MTTPMDTQIAAQFKRFQIIQEILNTEYLYVEDLKTLIKVLPFYLHIRSSALSGQTLTMSARVCVCVVCVVRHTVLSHANPRRRVAAVA